MPEISYSFPYEVLETAHAAAMPYSMPRRVEEMTTSPRWRSVLASAATAAALVVAPLAAAGAAHATDAPYPPHSTDHPYPPDHGDDQYPPYPPKPPKPHDYGKPDHPGKPHDENGHHPGKPALADTGDNDRELILGGVAASLVAAGVGTLVAVRRRNNS
jgi:LPXTG-motif cell wall-anchored protein